MHWFICFSHLNELPWRRYLNHVVSPTKLPTGWTSDWFNLENIESLPVVDFAAVPNPDPPMENIKRFSQDQQLFLELCCGKQSCQVINEILINIMHHTLVTQNDGKYKTEKNSKSIVLLNINLAYTLKPWHNNPFSNKIPAIKNLILSSSIQVHPDLKGSQIYRNPSCKNLSA